MAKKAINLSKTKDYQLNTDPDKGTDAATTWVLGALDSRVLAAIKDRATAIPMSALSGNTDATATLNINQTNFDVVVFGLKGFKNFLNEDDKQVEYKTAHSLMGGKSYLTVDPAIVSTIDPADIDELATQILDFNTATEQERKNSEA
jgi:hypothetical protein